MSSTFIVDPKDPSPGPLVPELPVISQVLDITSLDANAGQPARLHNLSHSNVVSNVNRSAQNAVSNQQAHSQLVASILGQAVNRVQNLGPVEARSSVDVLSNNEVAQALAGLKAVMPVPDQDGGNFPPISIWELIERLIELINLRLAGAGTLDDPFKLLDRGPIFAKASVTFAFPGKPAGSLSFSVSDTSVNVGP